MGGMLSYCGEHIAVKHEEGGLVAASLSCRSWLCPDCTENRKRQLIAEAIGGAPGTFLTLTSRRVKGKTANQAALELSRAWRLLRLRIMRKKKIKSLPFLAVIEATKSGWPHLHILLRAPYIHWRYIRFVMLKLINSPIIRIERINNKQKVSNYCAKYCSKCAHKFGTAKRYWQSRDYDLREQPDQPAPHKPGEGWEVWQETLKQFVNRQNDLGFCVVSISSRKVFVHLDTG